MFQEIREQPEALSKILDEGWGPVRSVARTLHTEGLRFVMLAARGTSDNAALHAKCLFEVRLGVPTALASPSAFTLYESNMHLEDVLVIGISQSGESKDVLKTIRRARELGAATLSVTNNGDSPLARAAEAHFWLRAGKEESVAATKTYTAELLLLYLLVAALDGTGEPEPPVKQLPQRTRRMLETGWGGTSRYRYAEYMTVVSRGYNFATAKEAALKLMETTYVVAEAFSEADLRHGPMAMIGQDFPVVLIVPPGEARRNMDSLPRCLSARGAEILVIGDSPGLIREAPAGFLVSFSFPEMLSPIPYALPVQLLAHDMAELKGVNPDAPRGLSKVTESW